MTVIEQTHAESQAPQRREGWLNRSVSRASVNLWLIAATGVILLIDIVAGVVMWFAGPSLGGIGGSYLVTNWAWAALHTVATIILIPLVGSLVVFNWRWLTGHSGRDSAGTQVYEERAVEQTAVTESLYLAPAADAETVPEGPAIEPASAPDATVADEATAPAEATDAGDAEPPVGEDKPSA
jgi:hypothetical protein